MNEQGDEANTEKRSKTNGENIRGHEGHDTGSGKFSEDELLKQTLDNSNLITKLAE